MKTTQLLQRLFAKNGTVPERNLRRQRQSALCLSLLLLSSGLTLALPPVSKTTRPIQRIGEISGTIQWPKSAINLPQPFKLVLLERVPGSGGFKYSYPTVSMKPEDTTFGKNIMSWGENNQLHFTIKRVPLGTIEVNVEGSHFRGEEVTLDFTHPRITGVHLKYQAPPK